MEKKVFFWLNTSRIPAPLGLKLKILMTDAILDLDPNNCKCGLENLSEERVYKGSTASPYQYPWFAQLTSKYNY